MKTKAKWESHSAGIDQLNGENPQMMRLRGNLGRDDAHC